ncbi:hypothetical protein TNCV_3838361 [Trichonephila clavipes]|nr:hypothetical protein TNCV_3838361 [Trichonephila clavipes]
MHDLKSQAGSTDCCLLTEGVMMVYGDRSRHMDDGHYMGVENETRPWDRAQLAMSQDAPAYEPSRITVVTSVISFDTSLCLDCIKKVISSG